jgi:radical SAM protein (TIGR01212 family)
MEQAKRRVEAKNREGKYIAYFQSFTNTYAPVEYLRRLYTEAVAPEYIVGLSVGTRPDCLEDDVISLLAEINGFKPVSVELGLQTVHEETARYIRRGYDTAVYYDAVRRLKAAGLEVVTHIILGLPGETVQMMMETTRKAVLAGTDGIKFHMLHVLRGTDLAREYEAGKVPVFTLEEYGEVLKECISCLPEHIVVHRITGDGAKKDLIAPLWSADKKRVLNYLHKVLEI